MASRAETTFNTRAMAACERLFGVDVTFTRSGVGTSDSFTARRDERGYILLGSEIGITARIEVRDFLLPINSVVISATTYEPRVGDRIIEGTEVWEIHHPDDSTPAVQPEDGGHDWRCHCKLID